MVASCQEKYEFLKEFIMNNQIEVDQMPWAIIDNNTIFTRNKLKISNEITDLAWRIGYLEQRIRYFPVTILI